VNRRTIVLWWGCLATAGASRPSFAQKASSAELNYRMRIPDALTEGVRGDLKHKGSVEHESDAKGLPVVAILVGVALLPTLVDAVMKLRARLVQPGLVIDTRDRTIRIETNTSVPKGYILLVSKEGSNLMDSTQLKDTAELAKALSAAVAK
jgi:hypothetical protein